MYIPETEIQKAEGFYLTVNQVCPKGSSYNAVLMKGDVVFPWDPIGQEVSH